MKFCRNAIQDERGMVLIISVLTLLVLTLVGMFAMNTSIMENMVAGNIRAYKDSFYKAEGAIREVALGLKITPDTSLATGTNTITMPGNLQLSGVFANSANITDPDSITRSRLNLVSNAINQVNIAEPHYSNTNVRIIHGGPAAGSSLSIGYSHHSSSRHRFFIFGRSRPAGASGRGVLMEIGYLRKIKG